MIGYLTIFCLIPIILVLLTWIIQSGTIAVFHVCMTNFEEKLDDISSKAKQRNRYPMMGLFISHAVQTKRSKNLAVSAVANAVLRAVEKKLAENFVRAKVSIGYFENSNFVLAVDIEKIEFASLSTRLRFVENVVMLNLLANSLLTMYLGILLPSKIESSLKKKGDIKAVVNSI